MCSSDLANQNPLITAIRQVAAQTNCQSYTAHHSADTQHETTSQTLGQPMIESAARNVERQDRASEDSVRFESVTHNSVAARDGVNYIVTNHDRVSS